MEKKNFLKVKTGIMMKERYILHRNENGTFKGSDEFVNMVTEKNESYRSKIITFVNDVIGQNWAVRFAPYTDEIHDVYIFCDGDYEFEKIKEIIIERINDTEFKFYQSGTTDNIENLW